MTKVVNIKNTKNYNVYIGRGSDFGNPFRIGEDGTRQEVVEKYREYFYDRITNDIRFKQSIDWLRGKILGCFCKPELCHGDVIIEYLDGKPFTKPKKEENEFFNYER